MEKKIATKKVQKSISPTDDIKRYLGALAEDFQGRVSAIAEQFLGLNEKLDTHTQMFGDINEKLEEHSRILSHHTQMFGEVNERLDKVDGRLDGIDGRLDTHTQMIGKLTVDVQEIKTDLKQKVDRSEFVPLEKRVSALEVRHRATA